jgi:iron(III) transport system substrate-binding protein
MFWMRQIRAAKWLTLCCGAGLVSSCGQGEKSAVPQRELVVYSSVDDDYARPLCERFSNATKIEVKLVPDSEETKSTGLVNRLIAEKNRPQADVFWSGDPVRAAVLQQKGLTAAYRSEQAKGLPNDLNQPEQHFTAFSARVRVIIYNRNRLSGTLPPTSLFDLVNPRFRGAACLANPLFGTTSMHAAALFSVLGEQSAKDFFRHLTENGVRMLSSNGEVRRRVAQGEFAIGLTDSDDASVAIKDGAPVEFVLPDQDGIGTLLVPNAAVLIAGGPNPENARQFIDFVISPKSERWLAESDAAQIPLHDGISGPKLFSQSLGNIRLMSVHYETLATQFEQLTGGFLEQWVQEQNNLPQSRGAAR